MLFQIPEFASHVWISAFDTSPKDVDKVLNVAEEKFPGVCVQLVDLDQVAGSRYLFLAILNALKSFHSKQPISKTLGMEILLFVAANRQISEALKRVGVTSETRRIAGIVVAKSSKEVSEVGDLLVELLNQRSRDELIDVWPPERISNVRFAFDIGNKELKATIRKNEDLVKAIERLAIERSAMLTIRK